MINTSVQDISTAAGSPGEHGVRRSLTMTLGSVGEGPDTLLKCVALCTALTGCIMASRTTTEISVLCHSHTKKEEQKNKGKKKKEGKEMFYGIPEPE